MLARFRGEEQCGVCDVLRRNSVCLHPRASLFLFQKRGSFCLGRYHCHPLTFHDPGWMQLTRTLSRPAPRRTFGEADQPNLANEYGVPIGKPGDRGRREVNDAAPRRLDHRHTLARAINMPFTSTMVRSSPSDRCPRPSRWARRDGVVTSTSSPQGPLHLRKAFQPGRHRTSALVREISW
jgi:hypothetical protein